MYIEAMSILVRFSEHIADQRISSMVSSLAAYGNVYPDSGVKGFRVEVFREAKLPRLKATLHGYEQYGF